MKQMSQYSIKPFFSSSLLWTAILSFSLGACSPGAGDPIDELMGGDGGSLSSEHCSEDFGIDFYIRMGQAGCVRWMVENQKHGVNDPIRDPWGGIQYQSPMDLAVESIRGSMPLSKDNVEVLKMLVKLGANINGSDDRRRTPISRLIEARSEAATEASLYLMAQKGIKLSQPDDQGMTPLHLAIETSNRKAFDMLLSRGAKIDFRINETEDTPMLLALRKRNVKFAETLVSRGADLSLAGRDGETPLMKALDLPSEDLSIRMIKKNPSPELLNRRSVVKEFGAIHFAAMNGLEKALSALVQNGAEIKLRDSLGRTALHYAAQMGRLEMSRLIVRLHGGLLSTDLKGFLPIHLALSEGKRDCAKYLISVGGAGGNPANDAGITPLHLTIRAGFEDLALEILHLNPGISLDRWDGGGRTALHDSVQSGMKQLVAELVSRFPDSVTAVSSTNETPLHFATSRVVAMMLVDAGARVDAPSVTGRTPLGSAIRAKRPEVAAYLLQAGADIRLPADSNGWSYLHLAAHENDIETARRILELGLSADVLDLRERTPLFEAQSAGFVELLAAFGGNPNHVSTSIIAGTTALEECIRDRPFKTSVSIVEALLKVGADPNWRDGDNHGYLDSTVLYGQYEITRVLLVAGAEPNAVGFMGKTALFYTWNVAMIRLLVAHGADPLIKDWMGFSARGSAEASLAKATRELEMYQASANPKPDRIERLQAIRLEWREVVSALGGNVDL